MNIPPLQFRPLSFSWVALHPQPKGVIRFIGGAFFGSLPTLFYRYLLNYLYCEGYTIIAMPFRFSFRHWSIVGGLFSEQRRLRAVLIDEAQHLGYETEVYKNSANYIWIGHSLGCKYIALLEFLSDAKRETTLQLTLGQKSAEKMIQSLDRVTHSQDISIRGQASLLIAPDIGDTESAIPIRPLARLLDHLRLGVLPTRKQTQELIGKSDLFNITALISFDRDNLAGNPSHPAMGRHPGEESDANWFLEQLSFKEMPLLDQELPGKHLEPLGFKIGPLAFNPFGDRKVFLNPRSIEIIANTFIQKLLFR
jgi:Protein of unknown function (DUF1350)